ncbi:DUF3592 domain-containing protein [Fulvivirga ligni]|uniref:DUF3592 domain-containing protein n=1 Tax=Fulvivirga ligni TaxID=2904246 RepID=UPI001F3F89DA|nr:DUF3592 domain-containing protein [Fulvivirga ligni]UII22297.1 DUF3592 domain-containing protein [Fulvivirga ligni]
MNQDLIMIIISMGFIVAGAKLWEKSSHLLANGRKTNAVIFKNEYRRSSDGGMYYPVVRFLTADKEWITKELDIGYLPAKQEGTKLDVVYDPEDPQTVEIHGSFQLHLLPKVFFLFGIILLIVGVLSYAEIIDLNNFNR